jgi:predicted amidohydrolase
MEDALQPFKAAVIQLAIEQGNKEKNLANALGWIDAAGDGGASIVCLPEYFSTGYMGKDLAKAAEPVPGPTVDALSEKAQEKKIHIVAGSVVENENNILYNTSCLIGPDGELIGRYRKTHPWRGVPKNEYGDGIRPGEEYPVFNTALGRLSIFIDSDLDFPEPARIMALEGAEILFWPAHCSGKWIDSHRFGMQQRAFENMVYVIGANRVGTWSGSPVGDVLYLGSSRIISPLGEILASVGEFDQGVAVANVDLAGSRAMRRDFNMFEWRVPHTYQRLSQTG